MNKITHRVYNFGAGPAALAEEVMIQAHEEFFNYRGMGISVLELSHRSDAFIAIAKQAEKDLRELMVIPDHYKVLFLHGGGQGQFAAIPMNLLGVRKQMDYFNTGIWSGLAIEAAKKYGEVNIVASGEKSDFTTIPAQSEWKLNSDAAYVHYCDNETVNGIAFDGIPHVREAPLVVDMSSNILSEPIDVNQFGMIYAGAQKNIGPAAMAIVIVKKDLIGRAMKCTPPIWDYAVQAEADSMRNTPPTFAWYMAGLGFQWLKRQGGVKAIAEINRRKAKKLYDFIDHHNDFYCNKIDSRYRSKMNVIFSLPTKELDQKFISEAENAGLFGLKGHQKVGGVRASIYNTMTEQGVDALLNFMDNFVKKNRR